MKLLPDLGFCTLTQQTILGPLSENTVAYSYDLLLSLLPLAVCIYGLLIVVKDGKIDFFYKIITIALYLYGVQNFDMIIEGMLDLFSNAGITIGGGKDYISSDILLDPSQILAQGVKVVNDIWSSIDIWDFLTTFDLSQRAVACVLILIYYGFMTLSAMIQVISYKILLSLTLPLFVFGILGGKFSFLSDIFISLLFRLNTVILVYSFMLSASFRIYDSILDKLSVIPSMIECGALSIATIALGFLSWSIPRIASSIFTGHQNISAATIVSAISSVVLVIASKGSNLIRKKR